MESLFIAPSYKTGPNGPLGEWFGREYLLYVSSASGAIRALCSQFRGFRETMARPGASYPRLATDVFLWMGGPEAAAFVEAALDG